MSKCRVIVGIFLTWLLALHLSNDAQAQQRCKWINVNHPKPLDTLSILPNSINVKGGHSFAFDMETKRISFEDADIGADSVLVCYDILPFDLTAQISKRDPAGLDSSGYFTDIRQDEDLIRPKDDADTWLDTDKIQKSGNLTRGISFGNQQNVFVNSSLNLQMDGQLTDKIAIHAVINDERVPYQPEGNTQNLQQFDKVFVQLQSQKTTLTVGDIVLQNPKNHFLRFYKNVQGGHAIIKYHNPDSSTHFVTEVGAALSKGKFASKTIQALEGIQGPYRLQGPNSERFIIIIANSEKVYLDGRLLTRGFDQDYTIDYNMAELTFNTNVVITQFSRIRVDFEYSERNYSRFNTFVSQRQQSDKVELSFNYYAEADNPRRPLLLELSPNDLDQLASIGDRLDQAYISSIDSVAFSENLVLYKKIDSTTVNGTYQDVFVYDQNPQSAFYQLGFTQVGPNKGNYVLMTSNQNGRAYQWVEPLNGVPQGDYQPIKKVPTPSKKQMITLGGKYHLDAHQSILGEVAFSQHDLNRYSDKDNEDNNGLAYLIGYEIQRKKSFLYQYFWDLRLDYEYDNPTFKPIDRYRSVEYNRNWSVPTLDTAYKVYLSDHLLRFNTALKKDEHHAFSLGLAFRNRALQAKGWQQKMSLTHTLGPLLVQTKFFLMQSRQDSSILGRGQLATWKKLSTDVSYLGKVLTPGYEYSFDHNKVLNLQRDFVNSTVMHFQQHKWYVKTADHESKTSLSADFAIRRDQLPINGEMMPYTDAQTLNLGVRTKLQPHHELGLTGTYRKVDVQLPTAQDSPLQEENLMSRLDWKSFFGKKAIRSDLIFVTASGRELKKEFAYIQVPTGQGTHAWRDDNKDGVQQLEEFYLAINPDEKTFAKVFTPTDQYILAYTNDLNYRLNIKAPKAWKKRGVLPSTLSHFSNISVVSMRKKITDPDLTSRYNPFKKVKEDQLISQRQTLRTTLFFDRTNPQYGADFSLVDQQQKQLLTNGFEQKINTKYRWQSRISVIRVFTLKLQLLQQSLSNKSDFLSNRNYQLGIFQYKPALEYRLNSQVRITSHLTFAQKHNKVGEQETLDWKEWGLDFKWSKAGTTSLSVSYRSILLSLKGEANSPVGYALMEAFQNGKNNTWSLSLVQRLKSGLQFNISYEGRTSEQNPIVHIGRMQVSLLF